MTIEMRTCKKCNQELPLIIFPLRNKSGTLRIYSCLDCRNQHRKIRYANGLAPHYDVANASFCLIYIVRNNINSKVYIGQTWRDLSVRWKSHLIPSTSNHCIKLRRAIKKYGKEKFHIELLTICHTQEMANYWEIFFIRKFNSVKQGYNILEYAFNRKGIKHSLETKKKMSKVHKGAGNANSILEQWQVDKIREEYKNYSNPKTGTKYGVITFLAKRYNVGISTIFEIVKGQAW